MIFLTSEPEQFYVNDWEPTRFMYTHEGKISRCNMDGSEIEVGTFKATVIDVTGALKEGMGLLYLFDAYSSTYDLFTEFYSDNGVDIKDKVLDVTFNDWDYSEDPNLLVIDQIVINKEFQGNGYGLQAITAIMQRYSIGVNIAVINPVPLQLYWDKKSDEDNEEAALAGLERFKLTPSKATAKLRRHFGKLGFKRVPKTDYMVRKI